MILAAALLVLVGLALFVAGILTGTTVLYWACVAVCVLAAILLVAVRRTMPDDEERESTRAERRSSRSDRRDDEVPPARAARAEEPAAAPVAEEPAAAPVAEARRSTAGHAAPESQVPERRAPEPPPAERPEPPPVTAVEIPAVRSAPEEPSTGAHAARLEPRPLDDGEPPVEEVEVTDLLLVVDLHDDVLVVDEHPRYHLAGCSFLTGRATIPLPVDEARTDGFTPCGICTPDRQLAERVRAGRRVQGG